MSGRVRPAVIGALVTLLLGASPALSGGGIAVGERAPDFKLTDQNGDEVALDSYAGESAVLVAFYPKDFTPG